MNHLARTNERILEKPCGVLGNTCSPLQIAVHTFETAHCLILLEESEHYGTNSVQYLPRDLCFSL